MPKFEIVVKQMLSFKKAYKKLHEQQKALVNNAIREIISDPSLGQEKKGDLSGIFVYKFKIKQREMLLAYEWQPQTRLLVALGVHENFYRDLKNNKKK